MPSFLTTQFQILSDLHLETPLTSPLYSTFKLKIHASNLFLLGDIGLAKDAALFTFLRTLPLPATHPSHPAAPGIQSALKDAQKGYGDMRGAWVRKCLETFGKRVVDRSETIDGVSAGREVGKWTEDMLSVAEASF